MKTLDLPLALGGAGGQAAQIEAALRAAIRDGRLAAGMRLPSSRSLALQWRVSRNAVVQAFESLQSDGLLQARWGAGTYVSPQLPPRPVAAGKPPAPDWSPAPRRPFALGATLTRPRLLRPLAQAVRRWSAEPGLLGYGDPRGSAALRQEIARHLAANRGLPADPEHIVIVNGVQAALRLCAEALLPRGSGIWFEEPGYPVARRTLEAAGLRPCPVPVDGEGLDVAAAIASAPRASAVYVTPSHQFPMGVTLSMARRAALLQWARQHQAWIFEDDYDSEFRYAGQPLTALAGIDGAERVIYIGTFSKTLFPGLRLAYMAVPPAALARVLQARAAHDRFSSTVLQEAVARFMANGEYAAHIRRMRKHYQACRDLLAQTLAPVLDIRSPAQGLHLLAMLPAGMGAAQARALLDTAQVQAWLLSDVSPAPARDALILGFSGYELPELRAAAQRLRAAAATLTGRS